MSVTYQLFLINLIILFFFFKKKATFYLFVFVCAIDSVLQST